VEAEAEETDLRINSTGIRTGVIALLGAGALLAPAAALASGPGGGSGNGSGDNGRGQQMITCDGVPYTVAVPNPENANGVGQIVGMKGHGIPVTGTFTITDTTTGTILDSEPFGNGAHPNQDTTECTGEAFTGMASDFFGNDLPPGVSATDTITGSLDVFVVLKV
jgi:hypothetical protein